MTPRAQLLPVNQFDHFYAGGDRIGALRHGPGGPRRPEEWIASTTTRWGMDTQGLSVLADGALLRGAVAADPRGWLGPRHLAAYGGGTELLVKLLDAAQRLPVHYHPPRAFAARHLGQAHGKTEAWYVLAAPDDGAVWLGFREPMPGAELRRLVDARNAAALLDRLHHRLVRPGDAILVPSGTAHAIGAGVFVVELQEPADLSVLLEWEGFLPAGERERHLGLGYDVAIQALDTAALPAADLAEIVVTNADRRWGPVTSLMPRAAEAYFRADLVDPARGPLDVDAGFAVLVVLDGAGRLVVADGGGLDLARGDAAVVPYAAGAWSATGDLTLVACRPPAPDAPVAPR